MMECIYRCVYEHSTGIRVDHEESKPKTVKCFRCGRDAFPVNTDVPMGYVVNGPVGDHDRRRLRWAFGKQKSEAIKRVSDIDHLLNDFHARHPYLEYPQPVPDEPRV